MSALWRERVGAEQMTRPKWLPLDGERAGARWECVHDDCDTWGGHGGERTASNVRRTKAAAREHTEETGHSTSVVTFVGLWAGTT